MELLSSRCFVLENVMFHASCYTPKLLLSLSSPPIIPEFMRHGTSVHGIKNKVDSLVENRNYGDEATTIREKV